MNSKCPRLTVSLAVNLGIAVGFALLIGLGFGTGIITGNEAALFSLIAGSGTTVSTLLMSHAK